MTTSINSLVRQTNRWREQYNPLRGLVISRVVSLLEAGERGEFADLQWTFRFVEKRFPVLRSLIARRQAALLKLEWAVKPVEAGKWLEQRAKTAADDLSETKVKEMAERQAAYLREKYEQIVNLKEAVKALALAEFRGFAMLSKLDSAGQPASVGQVAELHWLPQWNIVRDGLFGGWYWNPEARSSGANGLQAIDLSQVILRTVEMPIDEIGLIAYLRSNMSQKDWDAFVEIVGLPGGVVIMPPNIPPGKEDEYEEAAVTVAEGGSGALPNGSDIKFPTATFRGEAPFKAHLEWQEKDVVLAGTGGKLTMLNEATGIGGSQGKVHQDAFDEIATMEAAEISEVFQKQFDQAELAAAFPGEPVLAYFELQPMDESAQDRLAFKREVFKAWMADGTVSDVLANQTNLKQLTRDVELPVNEEYVDPYLPVATEVGVVTGGVVTDEEGDIVGGEVNRQSPMANSRSPIANRQSPIANSQRVIAGELGVPDSWLAPVRDLLAEIEAKAADGAITDADLLAFTEAATRRMPELFGKMDHQALADLLEAVLGQSVLEAVQERFDGVAAIAPLAANKNRFAMGPRRFAKGSGPRLWSGFGQGEAGALLNGDYPGHPFRGNQYTGAQGISDVLAGKLDETIYAPVTKDEAARIKAATGLEVDGYGHFLDRGALIHINKEHGVGREKDPANQGLTADDIKKIPEIVSRPDRIERGTSSRNLPAIKYSKRYEGTIHYVEEEWTDQKLLAAKTMYKERVKK